jgi:hypothetical protein
MKFNREYFLLGSIIFLVIIMSLGASATFVPYYEDNIFSNQYPYEGFSSLGYSTNVGNQNLDNRDSYLIAGDRGDCKKVYGFDGLFCKPYVADNKIDSFDDTPGNPSAFGHSSGLSNSMGSLQLSSDQIKLLQTRGGNQSGSAAEIGSK